MEEGRVGRGWDFWMFGVLTVERIKGWIWGDDNFSAGWNFWRSIFSRAEEWGYRTRQEWWEAWRWILIRRIGGIAVEDQDQFVASFEFLSTAQLWVHRVILVCWRHLYQGICWLFSHILIAERMSEVLWNGSWTEWWDGTALMCISQPDSDSWRISICSTKELQHTLHVASRKRDSSFFGYS